MVFNGVFMVLMIVLEFIRMSSCFHGFTEGSYVFKGVFMVSA